ncbi:MAG: hypothetical protein WKF75_02215, partial [Singulisphaera sp.]
MTWTPSPADAPGMLVGVRRHQPARVLRVPDRNGDHEHPAAGLVGLALVHPSPENRKLRLAHQASDFR